MKAILTDEDRQKVFESLPDALEGFMKKWGWLHFAKGIEAAVLAKLEGQKPAYWTRQRFGYEREFCEKPFTTDWIPLYTHPAPQQADRQRVPEAKAIAECLAVLRPMAKGKFPQEQALDELAGYLAAAPEAPAQASAVDERAAFTVVYRNPTPEEVAQLIAHPKSVWIGWCHAAHERDEARAALAQKGGDA